MCASQLKQTEWWLRKVAASLVLHQVVVAMTWTQVIAMAFIVLAQAHARPEVFGFAR
jgi:hypothetical protein